MNPILLSVDSDLAHQVLDLPESDGKPMGETEYHIRAILELFQLLDAFFREDANVYVGADMLFYYDADSPMEFIVPDVFVVKGVKKEMRRTYRIWDEKVAPTVVFEITSRGTYFEDLGKKRLLYETLGVREYFVFDPRSEYLNPQFQGYELQDVGYEPLPARVDGSIFSRELGLILQPTPHFIRPISPATGEMLPTYSELEARALAETGRAEAEAERALVETERAQRAEIENEQLRAEIERLKKQKPE